jgi:hypothetical protein
VTFACTRAASLCVVCTCCQPGRLEQAFTGASTFPTATSCTGSQAGTTETRQRVSCGGIHSVLGARTQTASNDAMCVGGLTLALVCSVSAAAPQQLSGRGRDAFEHRSRLDEAGLRAPACATAAREVGRQCRLTCVCRCRPAPERTPPRVPKLQLRGKCGAHNRLEAPRPVPVLPHPISRLGLGVARRPHSELGPRLDALGGEDAHHGAAACCE